MKKPAFSHVAWFAAGALCSGLLLHLAPPASTMASLPANREAAVKPLEISEDSKPSGSPVKFDLEQSLDRALRSAPGLEHSMDFLRFLEGLNDTNWQAAWTRFAAATKGHEGLHEADSQQLLNRIGEMAGQAGVSWFLKAGEPGQAKTVLTSLASRDPKQARLLVDELVNAYEMYPALLKGTGLHSSDSLLELAKTSPSQNLNNFGKEFIEAARLRGNPEQGEALWRTFLTTAVQESPDLENRLKELGPAPVLFRNLTAWKVEAARANDTPAAARDWLSSIIGEGYRVDEQNLSEVGSAAAETDPEGTLQWAVEMAAQFANGDPDQLQRITRQQGFEAARQWAKKDALALSQWLTANPTHPAYETGAATLYLNLKETDPPAATAWGATVRDVSLRQWVKLDPVPASQ